MSALGAGAYLLTGRNLASGEEKKEDDEESEEKRISFNNNYGDLIMRAENLPEEDYVGFISSIINQGRSYGDLTTNQLSALTKSITGHETKKDSQHFGIIGERQIFNNLTVEFITSFESDWGRVFVITLKDDCGHTFVYKGGNSYGANKGDKITLTATIKEHGDFRGLKQTRLARPAKVTVIEKEIEDE